MPRTSCVLLLHCPLNYGHSRMNHIFSILPWFFSSILLVLIFFTSSPTRILMYFLTQSINHSLIKYPFKSSFNKFFSSSDLVDIYSSSLFLKNRKSEAIYIYIVLLLFIVRATRDENLPLLALVYVVDTSRQPRSERGLAFHTTTLFDLGSRHCDLFSHLFGSLSFFSLTRPSSNSPSI